MNIIILSLTISLWHVACRDASRGGHQGFVLIRVSADVRVIGLQNIRPIDQSPTLLRKSTGGNRYRLKSHTLRVSSEAGPAKFQRPDRLGTLGYGTCYRTLVPVQVISLW